MRFNYVTRVIINIPVLRYTDAVQSGNIGNVGAYTANYTTHDITFPRIYLNINQLDALNFIMSLFHASTCFEHKCLSSGGQNYIIQSLVSSHI